MRIQSAKYITDANIQSTNSDVVEICKTIDKTIIAAEVITIIKIFLRSIGLLLFLRINSRLINGYTSSTKRVKKKIVSIFNVLDNSFIRLGVRPCCRFRKQNTEMDISEC